MTAGLPRVHLSDGALIVSGEVTADTVINLRKEGEKLIRSASH